MNSQTGPTVSDIKMSYKTNFLKMLMFENLCPSDLHAFVLEEKKPKTKKTPF